MQTSKPMNGLRQMLLLKLRKCLSSVACVSLRAVTRLRAFYKRLDTDEYLETRPDATLTQAVKLYLDDRPNSDQAHYRRYIVCVLVKNSRGQLLRLGLGDVQYESTLRTGELVTDKPEV